MTVLASDPDGSEEMGGLDQLFGGVAARLLRINWGTEIDEPDGFDDDDAPKTKKRNTAVQPLAEELIAGFMSAGPIEIYKPINFLNNGTGDFLNLVNNIDDTHGGINISNSNSTDNSNNGGSNSNNSSTHVYDNGIRITNNLGGDNNITIAISGDQSFFEAGDTIVIGPTNITNIVTNLSTIINGLSMQGSVIRQFALTATLIKGSTATATIEDFLPATTVTLDGKYFPCKAVSTDLVLAYWDREDEKWFAFASNHANYTGSVWSFETANPTLTINANCTITMGNLKECVFVDGQMYSREV